MRTIAIVGAGVAGLAAAIRLEQIGCRVQVFEARATTFDAGAGLILQPRGQRALATLAGKQALEYVHAYGARITRICASDAISGPIAQWQYAALAPDAYALGLQRQTLHACLSQCAPQLHEHITWATAITKVDTKSGLLYSDKGETWGPFDGIVVADGAHSVLRASMPSLIEHVRVDATSALVALVPAGEFAASDRLDQYYRGARHVSVWNVGTSANDAAPRCALALNVFADDEWQANPALWWRAQISALAPNLRDAIRGVDEPYHFRYRDVSLRSYAHERVVFIGDAAHAMSPQLGMGASLALTDAVTLGDALTQQEDMATAFAAFSANERGAHQRIQQWSRTVTPWFQSPSSSLARVRNLGLRALTALGGGERAAMSYLL